MSSEVVLLSTRGEGTFGENVLLSAGREDGFCAERKAFLGVFLFLLAGVFTSSSVRSSGIRSSIAASSSPTSIASASSSRAPGSAPPRPSNIATKLAVNSMLSCACLFTSSSTARSSHPNSMFLQALGKKLLNPSIRCCASVAQNRR